MGRPEGRLRWSAYPRGGAVCRHHVQYPAFAPGTSDVSVGFWPFYILLFIICPNCACVQLFLILIVSLYSVVQEGDVCPGASTPVKGPGPSLSQNHI